MIEDIDWTDPQARVSKYFSVHETLFLPSWREYHIPNKSEKEEILKLALIMDEVRKFVDNPILVHVWIRPNKANIPGSKWNGHDYNHYIGSTAKRSAHIYGRAIDFHVSGSEGPQGCAAIRQKLLPKIEGWDLRMEDNEGGWIHLDTNPVKNNRFFKP